jgi:hypothetical protein
VDVGGILFVCAALLVVFNRSTDLWRWRDKAVISISLAGMVLFRRWYLIWVVGFVISLLLQSGWNFVVGKSHRISEFIFSVWNTVLVCFFTILLLWLSGGNELLQRLMANYVQRYAAYHAIHSLNGLLFEFLLFFGPLQTIFLFLGLVVFFIAPVLRSKRIFWFGLLIVPYVLFHRIQDMGHHHVYLIFPSIALSILIGLSYILSFRAFKLWVYIVVMSLFIGNFLLVFVPLPQRISRLLPTLWIYSSPPVIRKDFRSIEMLIRDLYGMSLTQPGQIYTLSSSDTFNSDILSYGCTLFGYDPTFCSNVIYVSGIDTSEGFPNKFFSSSYVVVATPVQYHLKPMNQRLLATLVEEMERNDTIGKYFVKISGSYVLDQGVEVYVYQKIASIPEKEKMRLIRIFKNYYPNYKVN